MHNGYSSGWYDYRTNEICLSSWDGDDRIIKRVPFDWYFFVEKDTVKRSTNFEAFVDGIEEDGKYLKLFTEPNWKNRIEVYEQIKGIGLKPLEADVAPINRFLTDNQITFSSTLRMLYYDCETDARLGWGAIKKHKLLTVAFRQWDWKNGKSNSKTDFIASEGGRYGEHDFLGKFLEVIGKHDVIVAWNGDVYDEVVLKSRCDMFGYKPVWQVVNFLDQMNVFKKFYTKDAKGSGVRVSFSLENISKTLLGEGKEKSVFEGIPGNGPAEQNVWLFENDLSKLKKYNLVDVDRQVQLEGKEKFIDALKTQTHICNRFLSSFSTMTGYLNDAFILKYGASNQKRMNTKIYAFTRKDEKKREKVSKIEGAFVMKPVLGLHDGVCTIDFASLYPSIMLTFNISPETLVDESYKGKVAITENGARFRLDKDGIFPALIKELLELREPHKKRMRELKEQGKAGSDEWLAEKHLSDSYKVLSNALYGMLASPFLRYYSRECGEAITTSGQSLIKMMAKICERRGKKVVAGDTDSILPKCSEEWALDFIETTKKKINKWVKKRNGKRGFISLDLDAVYKRLIIVAKKKYAGYIEGEPEPDIKGLEVIRSDGCRYAREFQRRILDYLLHVDEIDIKVVKRIVDNWKRKLFNHKIEIGDLVITQSVAKKLDEYKVQPVHVRIARELLENGKEVFQGQKIPYIILGRDKIKKTETTKASNRIKAIHVDDFDGDYSAECYWKDKVFPPTKRILDVVFPKQKDLWKAILGNKKGLTLNQEQEMFVELVKAVHRRENGKGHKKFLQKRI